jgi:hypothetical protein
METLGIFSPRLNDFKSNRSHIKLVCFIYVHFEVNIISAISQLTVEDRLRRSYSYSRHIYLSYKQKRMIFNAKRKLSKEKDINIRLTAVVVGFKPYYVPKEYVFGALMVCL